MKVLLGYDSHRLIEQVPSTITLGGIKIKSNYKVLAHSDGDVIAHALIDALAPIILNKSIGELYSDKDESSKGASSIKRLEEVYKLCLSPSIINIDIVVQTDEVNISNVKDQIKNNISKVLNLPSENIGIKGKTTEGIYSSPLIQVWCVMLIDGGF